MLTFEQFEKTMKSYLDQRCENEKWIDKVNEVFHGAWESFYEHDYHTAFLNLFIEVMEDKEGWIPYFLYETGGEWFDVYFHENEGTTNEIDMVVKIDSYRKLYDLIAGTLV